MRAVVSQCVGYWLMSSFALCGIDVVCRSCESQNVLSANCVCLFALCRFTLCNIYFGKALIKSVSLTVQAMGICGPIYKTSKKMTETAVFVA